MFRTFLCLLLLAFFSPATGCYAQQNIEVKQSQEEEPSTWDFGTVKQGEILKHDFTLKNETGRTLNIKEVHTSCGCAVSAVKKMSLLAGEETQIEVKFDTKKYMGQVRQFVYVNTDDLDNQVIRYIIKANISSNLSRPQKPRPEQSR
ncbi:MAG: hypothetical protein A3K83_00575 [Omnitrophica WOR_2 bacterium RBG_13_44_8b]|nr:MAG: hypothetical protein A3K83_00575 [Omnitrophica WOR_2 bacterium RBG_13_44_8b]